MWSSWLVIPKRHKATLWSHNTLLFPGPKHWTQQRRPSFVMLCWTTQWPCIHCWFESWYRHNNLCIWWTTLYLAVQMVAYRREIMCNQSTWALVKLIGECWSKSTPTRDSQWSCFHIYAHACLIIVTQQMCPCELQSVCNSLRRIFLSTHKMRCSTVWRMQQLHSKFLAQWCVNMYAQLSCACMKWSIALILCA